MSGSGRLRPDAKQDSPPPPPVVHSPPSTHEGRAVLAEQYAEYVRQASITTEQRQATNRFFLALNSGVFASYVYLIQIDFLHGTLFLSLAMLLPALLGYIFCQQWRRRVTDYRKLNSAKFDVIHEMERHLPAQPYNAEYPRYARLEPFSNQEALLARIIQTLHVFVLGTFVALAFIRCDGKIAPTEICGGGLVLIDWIASRP